MTGRCRPFFKINLHMVADGGVVYAAREVWRLQPPLERNLMIS